MRGSVGEYLKCSIGLAPNRYLAKIAADMKKPDGLTVIRPSDLPLALHGLTLRDLPGVGSKTEKRLLTQGLNTMAKLTELSQPAMRAAWGSIVGDQMWHLLRGDDVARERLSAKDAEPIPCAAAESEASRWSAPSPKETHHESGA